MLAANQHLRLEARAKNQTTSTIKFVSWINRAIEVAERQRIPQSRLAEAAGVERARISRWKSGSGTVSLHQAAKIAALLGVSLDWLVADDVVTGSTAPAPALDRDSDTILRVVRSLELTPAEAIRRLATGGPSRIEGAVRVRPKPLPGPPPGWRPGGSESAAGLMAKHWTEEDDRILEEIERDRHRPSTRELPE